MPYIRIKDERVGEAREFECEDIRFGRDPEFEYVASGENRKVVSGFHARVLFHEGEWFVEDKQSRNGTYLDGTRVSPGIPARLFSGATIRLGGTGPSYRIEAVTRQRVSQTIAEPISAYSPNDPAAPMSAYDPPAPEQEVSTPREPRMVLLHQASGERFEVHGSRFRIGRGRECELRPVGQGDTSVSRVHAQIEIKDDGTLIVRDAGSRNGTLVNGILIEEECCIVQGDRLGLGATGPELLLEKIEGVVVRKPEAPVHLEPIVVEAPAPKPAVRAPRRSFEGKGATIFFKDMFEESTRKSRSRLRWVVWSFVALLIVSVGAMYWVSEMRVRDTQSQLAEQARLLEEQRARSDSLTLAAREEVQRLAEELDRASENAAPAAVLDSLRQELAQAGARTDALETALVTAQQSLDRELAMGDSIRRQAQADLARLRAQGAAQPTARLDSLVAAAEQRAADIEARMRAVRGVDLAAISQANQSAIGLVTVFSRAGIFDGSGFAITASGYFITNRHVALPDGASADSIFVTMADQRRPQRATLANVAEAYGPDLAVLKIAEYSGRFLQQIDWTGTHMRQGEPAALIGFPAGMVAAMDASRSGTVRTSMSAGIFSKVESERVQFDGFTIQGSSGSPIFNANGEVVAVHRSGLREAAGLGFGVPINQLLQILPAQAKAELGVR